MHVGNPQAPWRAREPRQGVVFATQVVPRRRRNKLRPINEGNLPGSFPDYCSVRGSNRFNLGFNSFTATRTVPYYEIPDTVVEGFGVKLRVRFCSPMSTLHLCLFIFTHTLRLGVIGRLCSLLVAYWCCFVINSVCVWPFAPSHHLAS